MSSKKIWFITGAGRGMGADFAKADGRGDFYSPSRAKWSRMAA